MKTLQNTLIIGSLLFTALYGCKDVADPPNPNEEELITTVQLLFTDTADSQKTFGFSFSDPDGAGGDPPTITDTIRLKANTVYDLSTLFTDQSGQQTVDITAEILEEADEHLVCYELTGQSSVDVTDLDGNNLPLGLEAQIQTGSAEVATLTVILRHQPDVKNGSCDIGETDVEVTFRLEVE